MDLEKFKNGLLFVVCVIGIVGVYYYRFENRQEAYRLKREQEERREVTEKGGAVIERYIRSDGSKAYFCETPAVEPKIKDIKRIKLYKISETSEYLVYDVEITVFDDKGFKITSLWGIVLSDARGPDALCIASVLEKW